MSDDTEAAVERFLREADAVYEEYDQGYLDPDAALERLRDGLEDLRSSVGDRDAD